MQGDHLSRETLKPCDITLLNARALQHAGKRGRAYESSWDTEHLGNGNCLIGRGKAQWSPRWEEWAAGRRDCTSAQSLTGRLSSSRMSDHVDGLPAKPMNLPFVLSLCVCPQRGQGWGTVCCVTRVLYRASPSDLRPHTGFVQNSLQSANLHYWSLILFSLIIPSCFSLRY